MKTFLLHLSGIKNPILIDETDYDKFTAIGQKGTLIRLKRAVINPSYVIAITPAEESKTRNIEGFIDELKGVYVITKESEEAVSVEDAFNTGKALPEPQE